LNLCERGELIGFLRKHGVEVDKGLGQHFLCSRPSVVAIVEAASGFPGVLEIGPGPGILTQSLSEKAEKMIAVEIDERMNAMLAVSAPKCEVRNQDALRANLPEIFAELPTPRVLVSNMPYYITGPLLNVFAASRSHFDRAVLMMQREVGFKIAAKAGKRERGALSVNLQTQFHIRHVRDVFAKEFLPPPKVDSIVLEFIPRHDEFDPEFYKLVKAGFSQPRKTMANNLANTLRMDRAIAIERIESVGLSASIRANELTEEDWLALYKVWTPQ
jgi:16S rRNA (adenine1518-N6/adenine1519-N6)-dimethyltransferase